MWPPVPPAGPDSAPGCASTSFSSQDVRPRPPHWLRRARQHLSGEPECVEQCYLAWVEAEEAQRRGAFDEAMSCARRMAGIARRCGSPDLLAMSTQAQASVLLAKGRIAGGLALLDDAMCSAMAGELSSFSTGWIYCLGLQQCMASADLERAAEWTDAAMAWCASMPEGRTRAHTASHDPRTVRRMGCSAHARDSRHGRFRR